MGSLWCESKTSFLSWIDNTSRCSSDSLSSGYWYTQLPATRYPFLVYLIVHSSCSLSSNVSIILQIWILELLCPDILSSSVGMSVVMKHMPHDSCVVSLHSGLDIMSATMLYLPGPYCGSLECKQPSQKLIEMICLDSGVYPVCIVPELIYSPHCYKRLSFRREVIPLHS